METPPRSTDLTSTLLLQSSLVFLLRTLPLHCCRVPSLQQTHHFPTSFLRKGHVQNAEYCPLLCKYSSFNPGLLLAAATCPGTCHTDFGTCNPACLWVPSTPFLPVDSVGSLAADSQGPQGPAMSPGAVCAPKGTVHVCASRLSSAKWKNEC